MMLVAAMAIQLSGCAQQRSWLSSVVHRDKGDQKLVEVDGKKKPKTATAKKAPTGKSSKDAGDKSTDSQLAKKSTTKPKVSSSDPTRNEVASVKETAAARTAKKTTEPLDSFLTEEIAALEAKEANTAKAVEKTVETKVDAAHKKIASVDPFADLEPDSEIAQTSAHGTQKRGAEATAPERASRVREAAHKVEDDLANLGDLPEWALDGETTRAKSEIERATQAAKAELDQKKAAASTGTKKIIRSAEQVQWELENTLKEPAPVSPAAAAAAKSGATALLRLCPEATGEVREQVLALNTSDLEVLKHNVHRIGRMGADASAAAPALEKLLKHKDGLVRIHAALALARMEQSPPQAVQTVVDGLKSSDPGIRSFAAATLAEMGPQAGEALVVLANSLDDRDGYVRLHAAEVLIRYEQWSYRSLESLLGCLNDKDENVRWLATYSLAELAPEAPEAVVALSKATRDPVLKVQTGAVYALGEIGPFAKKAAPSLRKLADDTSHAELQTAIVYALQQIEP